MERKNILEIAEHYKPNKSVETCNKTNSTKVYSIDFRAKYLEDQQNNVLYSWESFVTYVIRDVEDNLSPKIDKKLLIEELLGLSDSDFFLNLYLENGTIVHLVGNTTAPKDSFICYSVQDFRKKLKYQGSLPKKTLINTILFITLHLLTSLQ